MIFLALLPTDLFSAPAVCNLLLVKCPTLLNVIGAKKQARGKPRQEGHKFVSFGNRTVCPHLQDICGWSPPRTKQNKSCPCATSHSSLSPCQHESCSTHHAVIAPSVKKHLWTQACPKRWKIRHRGPQFYYCHAGRNLSSRALAFVQLSNTHFLGPPSHLTKKMTSRWGSLSSERVKDLLRVTKVISSRHRTWR